MTTQQPEALPALIERFRGLHFDHAPDGWPAVRTREITALLARITELESQLAQRFDAADVATAAQAVVDRWDTPLWKDVPATAEYIGRLRAALAAGRATAAQPVVPAEWPTNGMIDAGRKAAASQGRLLGSGQSLWHVFRAMLAAAPAQPAAQQGAAYGFFLLLPQRPKPEAPAGTVGLDWDAYSGAQMLAFGRDCSDAAIAALRTEQPAPATQQAVEREQERIAFKDAHRYLDLDEVPYAWGQPMFKHSLVEASWLGWIARASHGQAPAGAQQQKLAA